MSMGDLKALMQVPGIGKKGAERLVLELRDRLGVTTSDTSLDGRAGGPAIGDAGRAVARPAPPPSSGLGWSGKEADGAVAQLAPVADEQIAATGGVEVAVLLRQAMQLLGRS